MKGSDRRSLERVAQHWIAEGWQRGRAAMVDELHAAGFVDHDPAGRAPDNAGFKQGIIALFTAFPDFHARIEDLVVDTAARKVTVRWRATGTHRGAFMGYPPTGRKITFKGIEILQIQAGLITARWGEWDGLDILDQMQTPPRQPR